MNLWRISPDVCRCGCPAAPSLPPSPTAPARAYGDGLAEREVLALDILGELVAHDLIEVDGYQRAGNRLPAKPLDGTQTALASDEMPVERNRDGLQQADLGDAGGKALDIAHIAAVALADDDVGDRYR